MFTLPPSLPSSLPLSPQKYRFTADELIPLGHIGDGAFGTVTKMLFPQTETEMAVKVCVCVCVCVRACVRARVRACV